MHPRRESAAFSNGVKKNRPEFYRHYTLTFNAKKAILKGEDVKLGVVCICEFCGYTAEGKVHDKCPLCGAAKDKFKKI